MEDTKQRNEKPKETETLFHQFYSFLNDNDIKVIRKFLRRNDEIHTLNTCELNEDYPIDEYKFVKRNARLTIIHEPGYKSDKDQRSYSHYHPTLDKVNHEENDGITNSASYDVNNFISYDEFQKLITGFNKLYKRVENI